MKDEFVLTWNIYLCRHYNPTVLNLSRQMAAMEGTQAAYCTASGMSAISSVLMQLCSYGDHIVASNRLYGGTHAFLAHFLPRTSNITTSFVDVADVLSVKEAMKPSTKVLYFESVSNPQLIVANIPVLAGIHQLESDKHYLEICHLFVCNTNWVMDFHLISSSVVPADIAHERGVQVVVDNTFSPIIISPVRHGADVVVHSMTKFISGSSDIIAGAICGSADLISSMMGLHQGALMLLGPTTNPQVAFHLAMRLPHLELRMKEHCGRALIYSRRLKKLGMTVIYPGLEEHPQHNIMKELLNEGYGFGGMLCLDLGTTDRANDLMRHLQNVSLFGLMAVSLGYHDTLMSCSGSSTSSELSKEEQNSAGISEGLVRMSIGFTGSVEKRWSQLLDALTSLKLVPGNAK